LDVGATTGSNVIRVGGGNSGAADGGGVYVANNGTSVAAFGNYSNIIGGGYDASALLWATGNMRFVTAGGANVRMTIDTSGNVGIGTSSPATRLDILAVDAVTTSIRLGGTAASGGGATATVEVFGNRPDGNSTFYGRYGASFRRADGTAINNQPVGAYLFGGQWGTSTSFQSANMLYTASIAGVAESSWTSATAMPTAITFSTGSSGGILGSANQAYGTERMRISSAGNVGIATSSASQRLAINSANTSTNCLIEWRQGDVIQGYTGFGTDNALRLQTVGTQPVGMVAGGAGYAFISLNGSERARFSAAGGFSVGTTADPGAGAIFATGNITAYYSDARLKDFKGKIGDALYKVSQLNGYYYTENEKAEEFGYNNKELQVGVSAQEVQAVLPEVIAPAPFDMNENNESKSGENYMTVRYEKLVPLLIEAIKELTAKVEALEGKK
jgi:hypothetical protein